ncbi:antirepressor AbbA [Sutcliffiella deserti]|uniref:antirepressor AbbA n=1 Tax=Sutcliffiella deserti TaxID=2875501 RepID=UPI001CC1B9B9|nr:antirepressor AbbA [Sutcliffiella deserti]
MLGFTDEDKELLVSLLISSNMAKELVANEINDIEIGDKKLESETYKKLVQIFNKIS